jgi:hypothetical protein
MRAWMKAKASSTAELMVRWINILKVLPLVLEHSGVFERCAIFEPGYVSGQHAGPAALKTTYKHILAATSILVLHSCYPWLPGLIKSRTLLKT